MSTIKVTNLQHDSSAAANISLTSTGRVGIGTSSPAELLHVKASGNYGVIVADNSNTTGGGRFAAYQNGALKGIFGVSGSIEGNTTSDAGLFAETGGAIRFYTNGSPTAKAILDSSGRVGIGTTSPSVLFEVSSATDARIQSTNTAGTTKTVVLSGNGTSYIGTTTNHPQAFITNDAERARIDTSGRLLVGTSTARSNVDGATPQIQLEGTSETTSTASIIRNSASGGGSVFVLGKSRSASVGGNTIVNNGDTIGTVSFEGNDGTNFITAAGIAAQVDGTPGTNDMPGRLVFSVTRDGQASPTERQRISADGYNRMFAANNTLAVLTAQGAGTSFPTIEANYSATGIGINDGTVSFRVWSNGNVVNTNNSYGAISDVKLKENIVDASSQWDDLKALQVRNYNFKEGQTHTQIGLVAQEAELVSPGLVTESPDRDKDGNDLGTVTKSVNYSVLYMKAVKALQEAMERIETLEAKVAALESA